MHVTCGTDIELVCPVSSVKRADEVVRHSVRFSPKHHNRSIDLDFMVPSELLPQSSEVHRDR